ncbi:MAG: TetR/AcrR family transcriptional regulator [Armatimonadetes bacterium]|nr:TetR/AcrR family transcriptional regulator [Armatimonadota bacterium]
MIEKYIVANKRAETHEALLLSAKRVVARDGVIKLTLDAVAQEAGVSKGGILYHFPTKNALVVAMMESDIQGWKTSVADCRDAEIAAGGMPEAGRTIRAYVSATEGVCEEGTGRARQSSGDDSMEHWFTKSSEVRAGMIAAIAGDHLLLDKFRDTFASWQTQFENDGIDTTTATLVRLAADGLFFVDMLGLAPPQGELRDKVMKQLRDLATPGEPAIAKEKLSS